MYSEILLHAGLSKTGTTSIQDNCRRYRDTLARHGIVYPEFSAGAHIFQNHSIPVTVAVCAAPGRYGLALRNRFGDQVDRVRSLCRQQLDAVVAAGAGQVLVLSTELLESWQDDDLQSLRSYLAPHGHRLRVLVYLRSPESALESTLQERAKAGAMVEPAALVGRVRDKYQRLARNFPGQLETVNYHLAQEQSGGLVGSFLALAHAPDTVIAGLDFKSSNRRLSLEAFRLIAAVNCAWPLRQLPVAEAGCFRRDLAVLARLPGQPFRIPDFVGSDLHKQVTAETVWLEDRLGWQFPRQAAAGIEPLWQRETLVALEQLLPLVSEVRIRHCIGQFLAAESRSLPARRRTDSRILAALAAGLYPGEQ